MTDTVTYVDPSGAWTETLATTRRADYELVDLADNGDVGAGRIVLDDPDGLLGHSGDGLLGLKMLTVDEDLATPTRLWTGYLWDRGYTRGPYRTGAGNQATATIQDLNAVLGFREITGADGNRPRETVAARLAWYLGSSYAAGLIDSGYIQASSRFMEAVDYRGQRGTNVVEDCALADHVQHFVRYDDYADAPGLVFADLNTSDILTSVVRISNDLADFEDPDGPVVPAYDGSITVFPDLDAALQRTPDNVYAGTSVPWLRGTVYRTRPSTAATYAWRDGTAPLANVKTALDARRMADRFLLENRTEDDRLGVRIVLPPEYVNDLRAGDRIEVKFTHLRGYETWTWVRVVKRAVRHPVRLDMAYELDLELIPQETVNACAEATDLNRTNGAVTQALVVTSGATVVAPSTISGWFGLPVDYAVADLDMTTDPANANDGDAATWCGLPWTISLRYTGCVATVFEATLDAEYTLCSTRGTAQIGSVSWGSRAPDKVEYWDGADWIEAEGKLTYTPDLPTPKYWIYTFSDLIATTKLRISYTQCGVAGIFGLWGYYGVRLYDWQILGT